MGIKDQPTILFDAPDAAHYQTGIKGWVSRQGHYFGDGPQSEDMARYDGCTHVACRKCGAPTKKGWTACNSCREDAEIAENEPLCAPLCSLRFISYCNRQISSNIQLNTFRRIGGLDLIHLPHKVAGV